MDIILMTFKSLLCEKNKRSGFVHVITKKGKGYSRLKNDKTELGMEQDHIKWKQVLLLNHLNTASCMEQLVSETVRKLAREDERIVAITPAMPVVQS